MNIIICALVLLLQLYKEDIDNFGKLVEYPIPPKCMISVYGSPTSGTEPMLHYAIPLDGVLRPVTLFIHRSLRNTPPGKIMFINIYTMSYNIY